MNESVAITDASPSRRLRDFARDVRAIVTGYCCDPGRIGIQKDPVASGLAQLAAGLERAS